MTDEALRSALCAYVERHRDDLVELTRELVRRRSVLGGEEPVQKLVEARLSEIGFALERVQPDAVRALADPYAGYPSLSYEGRSCVVGRLVGVGGGRSLHLSGHVDVVPVDPAEEWVHDPWEAEVSEGRVWGRGAGDMKGGLAAYVVAAAAVAEVCGGSLRGDLLFSSVIEEECGGNGMWSVVDSGFDADATLIGEPTGLMLGRAATGVVWARVVARGTSGHSKDGGRRGPFEELAAAVAALREVEAELNGAVQEPVFAEAAAWPYGLTVGRVGGGVWTSSAPAELAASIRQGFGSEVEPAEVQARMTEAVGAACPEVEVSFEAFCARAWVGEAGGPFPESVAAAHTAVLGAEPAALAFTGTTDARYATGPCLCYGPRGGGFHGRDEWVEIESLVQTAAVVACAAAAWLS